MKHYRTPLAIVLFAAMAAFAQQTAPSPGDPPASKQDIQHLFDVMQIHQQMRQVMDALMKQQTSMIHETLKKRYPQSSADRIARADQLIAETMKDMPMDAMLDDMIPIYQRHFSKTDIDAMSTFYGSPTGQKMMREMPVTDLRGDAGFLCAHAKADGRHSAKSRTNREGRSRKSENRARNIAVPAKELACRPCLPLKKNSDPCSSAQIRGAFFGADS